MFTRVSKSLVADVGDHLGRRCGILAFCGAQVGAFIAGGLLEFSQEVLWG